MVSFGTFLCHTKGEDIKVISLQRKETKMKKLIKKIAKRVLKDETEKLENYIKVLEQNVFGKRKVIVSQEIMKTIVEILPDANAIGNGVVSGINVKDLKKVYRGLEKSKFHKVFEHSVSVKKITEIDGERGALISIFPFQIEVFIPVRKEDLSYNILGCSTEITTYFWDFYKAGIRMVSNENWDMIIKFIVAQNKVFIDLNNE